MTDIGVDLPGHGNTGAAPSEREELIARVDVRELAQFGDQFTRVFSPRFAEELALGRYVRGLLEGGRWHQVRIVPEKDGDRVSSHLFDVYGVTEG